MEKLNTNARVTEIGDVANRLVELYKKTTDLHEEKFLKSTFEEIEKQGKAITEAVKRDSVLSLLEEADTKRDNAVRVLSKLLIGYENIPVETLKLHGQKLATIFKKYGVKITDENYSSESNLIDSLLTDFSASDVQASITALAGVTEAIADLRNAQSEFASIRSQYDQALSEKENLVNASTLRRPLIELINKKLVPYLVAMQIAEAEKYGAFASNASKIVESVNEVVRGRSKRPA